MKRLLLIETALIAVVLMSGCGGKKTTSSRPQRLQLSDPVLISQQNRTQEGVVFGGWGPHLRAIMRMHDDSLWYVMDHSVGDVTSIDQLFYYQRQQSSWKLISKQRLIAGAGQGYAHITDGEEIFSYGVNFRLAQLHECRFNSKTLTQRDCQPVLNRSGKPIPLGGGANYVGAAISPQGTRLVWWIVVTADGSQQWRYVFNRGHGWQGPVVTKLKEMRGGFSYIYARFINESQVALSGQIWVGKFPQGTPQATLTHFRLGQPIEDFHTLSSTDKKGFPKSGSDLWVNLQTQTVHAVAEGFDEKLHYYFFHLDEPWRQLKPVHSFPGYFRARFTQTHRGDLLLVLGGTASDARIDVLRISQERIVDPIDWTAATKTRAKLPQGDHYAPSAIWIENRAYQTTPVRDLSFAFTGAYPKKDNEIWFYSGTLR